MIYDTPEGPLPVDFGSFESLAKAGTGPKAAD
jgi:hypothetical protein